MKTLKSVLVAAYCAQAVGCISAVPTRPLKVESTPAGARIEVDGLTQGTTPTVLNLSCQKKWVGLLSSPDGWQYSGAEYAIAAYPAADGGGYAQTKIVNACQLSSNSGYLHFDLRLDTVKPKERIEVEVK